MGHVEPLLGNDHETSIIQEPLLSDGPTNKHASAISTCAINPVTNPKRPWSLHRVILCTFKISEVVGNIKLKVFFFFPLGF
jgi:hypothetical protein